MRGPEKLPSEYHTELALLYLEIVSRERAKAGPSFTESTFSETRMKLLQLLRAMPHRYSPERLLSRFPVDALYEERAQLLSRIKRHSHALDIYVNKLGSLKLAEEYCDRVYEESLGRASGEQHQALGSTTTNEESEDAKSVYSELLKVVLEGSNALLTDAIAILLRKSGRFDGVAALRMLPQETCLATVLPFLSGALKGGADAKRSLAVVRALKRSENQRTKEELWTLRKKGLVLSPERTCGLCFKRIGGSVFALHEGVIVHYSCRERLTSD